MVATRRCIASSALVARLACHSPPMPVSAWPWHSSLGGLRALRGGKPRSDLLVKVLHQIIQQFATQNDNRLRLWWHHRSHPCCCCPTHRGKSLPHQEGSTSGEDAIASCQGGAVFSLERKKFLQTRVLWGFPAVWAQCALVALGLSFAAHSCLTWPWLFARSCGSEAPLGQAGRRP